MLWLKTEQGGGGGGEVERDDASVLIHVTFLDSDGVVQHTVSSACAAERDSLTLATFANFSQREQWKFKQSNVMNKL